MVLKWKATDDARHGWPDYKIAPPPSSLPPRRDAQFLVSWLFHVEDGPITVLHFCHLSTLIYVYLPCGARCDVDD